MRILLVLITLISSLFLEAQAPRQGFNDTSYYTNTQKKKWFLTSYSHIGIGFNYFHGGSATVVSTPVGLQLNRQLNNNLYAFTGVSLTPTYINFNHPFLSPGIKPSAVNGFKSDYFGLHPSVNMGLMYVNEARTFSISGSIGVERSAYPVLPYPPANMQRTSIPGPIPVNK